MTVRTIATDLKLTGEKEFNDQMKAVNSNLKNLKTDMAAVSSEFEGNADSVDALAAKQKILQETFDQQRVKVDALASQYEKAKKKLGENHHLTDKYRQGMNQAIVTLNKHQAALEKNREALAKAKSESEPYVSILRRIKSAVGDAADSQKDLRRQMVEVARETPVVAELLDVASAAAKGLNLTAKGAGKALRGIGTAAGGLAKGVSTISAAAAAGAAAVAAGGVAVLGTMASYAKEAAEAAKAASEAGETLSDSQQQWLAFAGQLDSLDSAVANAKSALGGVLLPALSELSTEGAAFLDDFARDMEAAAGDTGKQGKILSDYIVRGAGLIKDKLPEYVKLGKELFSGLGDGLAEAGPEMLEEGMDLVMELLDEIVDFAPELADAGIQLIEKFIDGLTERGPEVLVSAVGMVTQIVTGLAQAAPKLIPAAGQLIIQLLSALAQAAPQLLVAGGELVLGIISGIRSGIGDLLSAADTLVEDFLDSLEGRNEYIDIGLDIVRGIWEGISNGTDWILGKLEDWVGNVIDWICELLDINSPSGVTERRIGVQMARGVGVGWEKELARVNKLIAQSINTSFDVPALSVRGNYTGRNYATASGSTFNFYFYAKQLTEADMDMAFDYINEKLGGAI